MEADVAKAVITKIPLAKLLLMDRIWMELIFF
jgi:hypothetical protein